MQTRIADDFCCDWRFKGFSVFVQPFLNTFILNPCHAEYFIYYTPHQIFAAFQIQASIVKNSVDPGQIGFIRSQLIWIQSVLKTGYIQVQQDNG